MKKLLLLTTALFLSLSSPVFAGDCCHPGADCCETQSSCCD